MVKKLLSALIPMMAVLAIVSCKPDEQNSPGEAPYINASSQSVGASETSATIEVSSNVDWAVSCSADWITSYTQSGSNNDNIAVSFGANTETAARTADFVISGPDGISTTVSISQAGASQTTFTLSSSSWDSSVEPRELEFDVATVLFASAYRTSSFNWPVTSGGDIELKMNNSSAAMVAVTFDLEKVYGLEQTASLLTSTDGGETYSETAVATSSDFSLSATSLPTGTNAVKVTFISDYLVGISSIDLTYIE